MDYYINSIYNQILIMNMDQYIATSTNIIKAYIQAFSRDTTLSGAVVFGNLATATVHTAKRWDFRSSIE